jgi:hypothetical protein
MTRRMSDQATLGSTRDRKGPSMLSGLAVEEGFGEAELPFPDFVEPLRAWRLWAIEDVGGSPRLRSLYQRCVWPTGVPLAAHCHAQRFLLWRRSPHETPVDTCSCGIYAVGAERIRGLWRAPELAPGFSLVIGTVSLWGAVVECEQGWRAGFAYPRELFVPSLESKPDETAAGLSEYGVPVEVLGASTIGTALDAVAERAV